MVENKRSDAFLLNSGHFMPFLGLGTSKDDPIKVKAAVFEALKIGYKLIDTAFVYQNEKVIGEALNEALGAGIIRREQLFVITKLPPIGHCRHDVSKFLKMQLEALKLNFVDLYLIHMPTPCISPEGSLNISYKETLLENTNVDHLETWKGMEDCVDLGLTKSIGLSNFNSEQIGNIWDNCRIKPSNLQIELHIYLQQSKLIEFCRSRGITITAYGPLGSPGHFKNRAKDSPLEIPTSFLEDYILKELAAKYKKTVAQIALRWIIQKGVCPIPKSVTFSRLKENADVFDFILSENDMKTLETMNKNFRFFNYKEFGLLTEHPFFPFKEEIDF